MIDFKSARRRRQSIKHDEGEKESASEKPTRTAVSSRGKTAASARAPGYIRIKTIKAERVREVGNNNKRRELNISRHCRGRAARRSERAKEKKTRRYMREGWKKKRRRRERGIYRFPKLALLAAGARVEMKITLETVN